MQNSESIRVYSVSGKQLLQKKYASILDISKLAAGVYFLKIDNYQPIKLIKK